LEDEEEEIRVLADGSQKREGEREITKKKKTIYTVVIFMSKNIIIFLFGIVDFLYISP